MRVKVIWLGKCIALLAAFAADGFAYAAVHRFKIVGTSNQAQQIEQSLAACPSLAKTLDDLTRSAGLTQIRITTSDETKKIGPFLAAVSGDEILLAADWLELQKQPFFDVRRAGEILPDNLCFDLGHLADHVANPPVPPGRGGDIQTYVDKRIKVEARAFLRAWPYVIEAARIKNAGKALNGQQVAELLLNLRYRFAFMRALDAKDGQKITILADGSIPETEESVAAIAAAISHSSIADLQEETG